MAFVSERTAFGGAGKKRLRRLIVALGVHGKANRMRSPGMIRMRKQAVAITAALALAWVLSLCPADRAFARSADTNGLIFVDSSGSVRAFEQAYRSSMLGMATTARDKHRDHRMTIHFVPIGDGSAPPRVLPNTGMPAEQLQQALAVPFTFNAQTTLLTRSLEVGRSVTNVSRVMFVSDFVPDHTPSGPTFAFSRQDMADLLSARDVIKSYLDNPRLERFGIVLLGWDRDPATYLTDREKANPEEVVTRASRQNASRLAAGSGPDRQDNDEELYRKAIAAVLVGLQRHSPKLTITPMPTQVGNSRNEQGFFIEACRVFDAVLAGDRRCGGDVASGERPQTCSAGPRRGVRDTFTVAVDRGRFVNDQLILNVLKEKFRPPLDGAQLVTPRKVTILDKSELGNVRPDYELKLCPLRAGGTDCDGPFSQPNLRALGWQLGARRSEQDASMEPIEGVRAVSSGGGANPDDAARDGLANDLERVLRRHIAETHRPPRQDLWVTLKTSAGVAIPRGHRIVAKYKVAGQEARSEGTVIDEAGMVVLPLPTSAENVVLYHHSKRTLVPVQSGAPPQDAEIALGTAIPQRFVGSCEVLNHQVPDSLFIAYQIKVTWPPDNPRLTPASHKGRLAITLQGTDYAQPIERQAIVGNSTQMVKLPPGGYSVAFRVEDPRLLQPDTVDKTWVAGVQQINFQAPQPASDADTVHFLIAVDEPLLRPDGQAASEQVIEAPNYLGPPAQVWTFLKGLASGLGTQTPRLTPRGELTVVQSANVFWGALSVAAEVIDRQALGTPAGDFDATQVRQLLRLLLDVVERSSRDTAFARDIARGLHRIGLVNEDGQEHPGARALLGVLLYRLSEGSLCGSQTTVRQLVQRLRERNPAYTAEVIAEYNSWLLQSAVPPEQMAGAQPPSGLSARSPSQTPFRIELVRRCHVPLGRDGS